MVPGQDIGLAVAREMVEGAYGGALTISESALGGARVEVEFRDVALVARAHVVACAVSMRNWDVSPGATILRDAITFDD